MQTTKRITSVSKGQHFVRIYIRVQMQIHLFVHCRGSIAQNSDKMFFVLGQYQSQNEIAEQTDRQNGWMKERKKKKEKNKNEEEEELIKFPSTKFSKRCFVASVWMSTGIDLSGHSNNMTAADRQGNLSPQTKLCMAIHWISRSESQTHTVLIIHNKIIAYFIL